MLARPCPMLMTPNDNQYALGGRSKTSVRRFKHNPDPFPFGPSRACVFRPLSVNVIPAQPAHLSQP
jgi:hypothetical protein